MSKNQLTACLIIINSILFAGCNNQQAITVLVEARNIKKLHKTPESYECILVGNHVIENSQPDNISRELKNIAYQNGANRFFISKVLSNRSKPNITSVEAKLYNCDISVGV